MRTDQNDDTPSVEARFASNMRALRETLKLSQEELAEQMSQQGFPFHQATIYKIESGGRRVQLSEAVAIAAIFGVTVERMTTDGSDDPLRAEIARWRTLQGEFREQLAAAHVAVADNSRGLAEAETVLGLLSALDTHWTEPDTAAVAEHLRKVALISRRTLETYLPLPVLGGALQAAGIDSHLLSVAESYAINPAWPEPEITGNDTDGWTSTRPAGWVRPSDVQVYADTLADWLTRTPEDTH